MPPRPKSKRTASLPVVIKDQKQVATRPVMLLVLGPHRSGTSLTTRMLECLGAENSSQQMWTGIDNPKGFFEDAAVYSFNETVLLPHLQQTWSTVSLPDWSEISKAERSRLGLQALAILRKNYSASSPLSILKEPRINNTLPFWVSLLEHAGFDVRFVCTVRDPVSAARSLSQRNGFTLAHGSMIYLSAWLAVLPHLQERQVAFVQFDEIFASPAKVLTVAAQKLGLPLPADFDQRVHQFTSEHLDPSLRHGSLPREDVMLEPDLPPLVAELYRVLLDAAQSQNIRKTAKFVAYAERQVESIAPLLADYDAKQARLNSLQTESEAATAECTRLRSQLDVSAQQNHAALVAERDALAARLTSLESEHSSLATLHSSLVAERDDLVTRHQQLATALDQLQGQHSSLVAERESLRHDTAARQAVQNETQAKLATAEKALTEARAAREKTEADAKDTAEENELLLGQLHQVQEELEKYFLENRELKQQHDHVATGHASLVAERDDLATRYSSLVTSQESLVVERDDLETNLQSALQDNKELAENIATRFHELAILAKTIAERDAELQRVKQDASYRGTNGCLIEKVSFADAREHPPHNHLNINLHNLQAGDTQWDILRIRLVEHHGRPGLAIFEPALGVPPLKKWSLSGEEDKVPFYLLVPEDNNGRRLLDEAAGVDFSFLQFLVVTLEAELGKSSASPDLAVGRAANLQGWRQRATSLRQIFDRQSRAFFRHGKPRARHSPEEGMAKAVKVTVPDCYFDGRFFPIVEFTWKPQHSTLLFSAKDNPVPLFVGTEALCHWSAGSALEVCFEGNPKTTDSVHKIPSAESDARLAKAIAQKLPALLPGLPASLQRKARGLGRSLVGERRVTFRRPAKSSRS